MIKTIAQDSNPRKVAKGAMPERDPYWMARETTLLLREWEAPAPRLTAA